jgi:hypothetical protein
VVVVVVVLKVPASPEKMIEEELYFWTFVAASAAWCGFAIIA